MKKIFFSFIAIITVFSFIRGASAEQKGDPVRGKQTFQTTCASCHGPEGKGDGPAAAALNPKPKNLTDAAYMSTLTDQYLHDVIAKGGVAVGKSPAMPAWGGALSDQDIQNVIAYIRQDLCKCQAKQ